MKMWKNVPKLETIGLGTRMNIVVRNCTKPIFQKAIQLIQDTTKILRVVVVGSPGTGKTTTTAVLGRMLLEQGKTVVYEFMQPRKPAYLYEMRRWDEVVEYCVRKSSGDIVDDVPSLQEVDTYYVLDPGQTETSCLPSNIVLARVIFVSSPNQRHWGGKSFLKDNSDMMGFFVFHPLWTLDELLSAKEIIKPSIGDAEVRKRYRLFGGVPRHVFSDHVESNLDTQEMGINSLSVSKVELCLRGDLPYSYTMLAKQAKASVLGFQLKEKNNYLKAKCVMMSDSVYEKICKKFIDHMFSAMLRDTTESWRMLEAYVRQLLMSKQKVAFECGLAWVRVVQTKQALLTTR